MDTYLSQGYLCICNDPDWNSNLAFQFLISTHYQVHYLLTDTSLQNLIFTSGYSPSYRAVFETQEEKQSRIDANIDNRGWLFIM